MSRWYRTGVVIVVVCACVLAASWATAQPPKGGRGGGGMGMMGGGMMSAALLRSPQVQQELRFTEDQKQKLQEAGQQMAGDFAGLATMDPADRMKKMEELQKNISDKLSSLLTPEQNKRLKEIGLQVQGAAAVMTPEVAQELGVTEDQKEKIRDAMTDMRTKAGELRGTPPEQMQAKVQQLRKDLDNQIMPILTPQQRQKLDEMQGAKIDIDMSALMGGGRRPGGQP
jgi:Spy/CpxP family protein refolding chaperone